MKDVLLLFESRNIFTSANKFNAIEITMIFLMIEVVSFQINIYFEIELV